MYRKCSEFEAFKQSGYDFMCKVMADLVGSCVVEQSYADHVRVYNGGVPLKQYIPTNAGGCLWLARFHHYGSDFSADGWHDIVSSVWTRRTEYSGMDERLWPIGSFYNGDELCFDFRVRANAPPIVVWCHEDVDENDETLIIPVCESFTELLSIMQEHDSQGEL